MKKFILILLFVLTLTVPGNAQQGITVLWDYPQVEVSKITRFETRINSGSWVNVGIPVVVYAANGLNTYSWVIPYSTATGSHTLYARACDTAECSVSASLVYKNVLPIRNLRIME